VNPNLNASIDKLNRSQQIECISELDSEHEFSCIIPQPCPGGDEDKNFCLQDELLEDDKQEDAPIPTNEISVKRIHPPAAKSVDHQELNEEPDGSSNHIKCQTKESAKSSQGMKKKKLESFY
jgi:hypothetical protein